MKLSKNAKITLTISVLVILMIFAIFRETYSMNEISDNYIVNNINKLNTVLETNYDIHNKFSLTSIVDDNGKPPAYSYYNHIKSRGIRELKAYDDKIFMGLGDWTDNTGPAKILYYDTLTNKVVSSGTIMDEAVENFNIIDNKIYTTGTDPRTSLWDFGSYYVYNKENNNWEQHEFQMGWIHVFEIIDYNGKLFMCGATNDSKKKTSIQVSFDNGNTFENVTIKKDGEILPFDSYLRFHAFVKFKGDLYAYTYSDYYGLYKYDEEKNEFNFLRKLGYYPSKYGVPESLRYNVIHFRNNTVFKDHFIYITGTEYVYKTPDMINYELIPITTPDVVQDAVVHNDTLYTLSYQYLEDKTFSTRIYSTKDLETFDLVYEFNIDTLPFSIEYHNNQLYIGTIWDENSKDYNDYNTGIKPSTTTETGSLYKIDLNKLETYLELDKENKVINITKNEITYPVNYTLNSDNSVFTTTLTFDNSMTQNEWELEYSKLENLNLIYTLEDTKKYVNLDSSTSYFNEVLNTNIINSNENYSTATEFAEIIFSKPLNITDKRFNITTENISKTENDYQVLVTLTVYNIDDNITSEKYTINEENKYIYAGNDKDPEIIKSNINKSGLVDLEIDETNHKLLVKYKENIMKEYTLIILDTNKKIVDKNIYVGTITDENISSEIEVINGDIKLDENKLKITYNDNILEEYSIIRVLSNKILVLNDEKAYISNYNVDEIQKEIKVTNAECFVNENQILITKENNIIANHDILYIDFGILPEKNKTLYIPEGYSYDEFINNITMSEGITYKLFKETNEITNGNLEEQMILKIYYDDKEIDMFNIEYEYIEFDSSLNIDNENKYILNIYSNTKVSDIISKIETTGTIIIKNNNNELLGETSLIGTGTKITINMIKATYEYEVIVNGDIDGDGLVSLQDIFKIANYVYNDKTLLKGVYLKAVDYDNNNIYNLQDIMKASYRHKKEAVK